jgi:MAF protein
VQSKTVLLLASNSPRRRQLLALGGWMFSVLASDVDEARLPNEAPADYVVRLAEAKARAVARDARGHNIVIGADTAVVDGADILGKPVDMPEAVQFLKQLRGHVHQVYTGIALLRLEDGKLVSDLCVTDVPMRDYSDEEIDAYVQSGDPLDKAGAYGIQHPQFKPVERMRGCYPSVMGLPLCRVTRVLHQLGVPPVNEITAGCQDESEAPCPVYSAIMQRE